MPQDKKYAGEDTELVIGDGNTFRESCTISLGTAGGGGVTSVGSDNWIMASVHIAHDCVIGDHTILANNATLAGHVTLGDWVILGGMTAVHQFCAVGAHAMAAGGSIVLRDVPPYVICSGNPAEPHGINSEGLKRRGFDTDTINLLRRAYKTLYRDGLSAADAVIALGTLAEENPAFGRCNCASERLCAELAARHRPLMAGERTIAFVAGEASGDLLAAPVVSEILQRAPDMRCVGIGGDRMIGAGFDAWHHVRELSVRGYVEVLRHLPRLLQLRRRCATGWWRRSHKSSSASMRRTSTWRSRNNCAGRACAPCTSSARRSGPGAPSASSRSRARSTACCSSFRSSRKFTTTPEFPRATSGIRSPA